jgi:hypothetical protein
LAHIALAELPFPAFPQISALFSSGVAGNTECLHMHSRTSALFEFGIASRVNPQQAPQTLPNKSVIRFGNRFRTQECWQRDFLTKIPFSFTASSDRDSLPANLPCPLSFLSMTWRPPAKVRLISCFPWQFFPTVLGAQRVLIRP